MPQRPIGRRPRRGATVVEFAAVAPVLFLLLFGCIEFGRALMVAHSLEEATRAGCRVAILRGSTNAEILAEADRILAPAGVTVYTLTTTPTDMATANRWAPVTVEITTSFDDASWLPIPRGLSGQSYSASCTMPKEYPPDA